MSNAYVATNKASSTLAANIPATNTGASARTITLATGEGDRFPTTAQFTGGADDGNYTLVTLQNTAGVREIVCVVDRVGDSDVLTVGVPGAKAENFSGRNYEGSFGAASWVIGDVVSCRPTAGLLVTAVGASALATAAQTTANTGVTNAATAQATADAALPKAGGVMTGDLTLGAGKSIIFEGTTDDAHETTLSAGEPTADRAIALPDQSGTVAVQARGADIASASTINLTTATGDIVDVTGTTAITAVTLADGIQKTVRFTGALTLTNGASLVLPGAANIDTAAGDIAVFRGYASSVVRCVAYQRASGAAVVPSVLSKSYDSGNQAVSVGGALTLPHLLGAIPKVVQFVAKCTTDEAGYVAGDEVLISSLGNTFAGAGSSVLGGFAAQIDATNIKIKFAGNGSLVTPLYLFHKTTGELAGATVGNWVFIARAHA